MGYWNVVMVLLIMLAVAAVPALIIVAGVTFGTWVTDYIDNTFARWAVGTAVTVVTFLAVCGVFYAVLSLGAALE